MLQKQELESERISVFFELITSKDSRYDRQRNQYPGNIPKKNPVLPIVETDVKNISPLVSARLKEQMDEYIENRPEIMNNIINCENDNIIKSYPVGKPHTEEIKVCNVYILRKEDDVCVISEFDFEELLSLLT